MSELQTEQVLVVPTAMFRQLGYFQGFSFQVDRYLATLLDERNTSYQPRSQVETNPEFKQLIPYVIFRHTDNQGCQRVLQYTRGTGQGEGRLHCKHSVGIGGHISAVDAASPANGTAYQTAMQRELHEEVRIETTYRFRCVGLINDDQTDVGRVHLGVVHLFDVDHPAVRPNESDILACSFRPVEQILADMTGFETWSVICMEALFAKGSRPT